MAGQSKLPDTDVYKRQQQEMPKVWYSFTPEYMYFGGIYNKETGQTLFLGPVLITECSLKQAETICLRLGRSGKDSFIIKQCFDNTRPHSVNEPVSYTHLFSGKKLNPFAIAQELSVKDAIISNKKGRKTKSEPKVRTV